MHFNYVTPMVITLDQLFYNRIFMQNFITPANPNDGRIGNFTTWPLTVKYWRYQ